MKLDKSFYNREDVTKVARDLLGKVVCSKIDGKVTSGIIVETEAYSYKEKACHAHLMKRTKRTEVLFAEPGTAYVYLCYGIHKLFNIVTNKKDIAEAVLIRAIEPLDGKEIMLERRPVVKVKDLGSGPGKLTQAMGIDLTLNNKDLFGNRLWVKDENIPVNSIESTPRIGVAYAEEDAHLPWRFTISGNSYISKGPNKYK